MRKEVLEHLGVRPGDRLEVELLPHGRLQAAAKPRQPISSIFGLMKRPGEHARTIEEINKASEDGWAGRR